MIGIGIPISHRRTPRMDLTSFSDCRRNVSGLTEFRAASATVRPGDNPLRLSNFAPLSVLPCSFERVRGENAAMEPIYEFRLKMTRLLRNTK